MMNIVHKNESKYTAYNKTGNRFTSFVTAIFCFFYIPFFHIFIRFTSFYSKLFRFLFHFSLIDLCLLLLTVAIVISRAVCLYKYVYVCAHARDSDQ